MLKTCPECELPVSDKALSCPHCGFPLKDISTKISPGKKSRKRKRLPNGFGQITKLSTPGLRKPWRAMVTVGKNSFGGPIQKLLKPDSYFETYNDAYLALVEYNKNPYDLDQSISVEELYSQWTASYFPTLKSESSTRTITSAWAYCSSLYRMRASDLRARHIKGCIDEGYKIVDGEAVCPTPGIKARIKSMFNLMLDYAVEFEIADKNYARTFNLSDEIIQETEKARRAHIPFTQEEIQTLWDRLDETLWGDVLLIQCYGGWRPQELGLIELANVDLERNLIVGGIKSEAGTNRIVPIHSAVRHLVRKRYDEAVALGSKYLINCTDTTTHRSSLKLTYEKYQYRFKLLCEQLNMNPEHRAHDGRMHFVTQAKKAHLDDYAIKYIVGHKISDITEKVYTKREIEWLQTEIEKIKGPVENTKTPGQPFDQPGAMYESTCMSNV